MKNILCLVFGFILLTTCKEIPRSHTEFNKNRDLIYVINDGFTEERAIPIFYKQEIFKSTKVILRQENQYLLENYSTLDYIVIDSVYIKNGVKYNLVYLLLGNDTLTIYFKILKRKQEWQK